MRTGRRRVPRDYLADYFGVEAVAGPELPPTYNAAPTATLYAVAATRSGNRLGTMRWGLVPPWAQRPDRGPRPINARVETLLDKATFADALDHGRTCLVPVDGFYEWQGGPGGKQPFLLLSALDAAPLALAGLWSRWSGPDAEPVTTFTIVTCEANDDVSSLHDRMPVLLGREQWETWLDRSVRAMDRRLDLLRPAPAGSLVARPVSRRVNDARNDDAELIEPASLPA